MNDVNRSISCRGRTTKDQKRVSRANTVSYLNKFKTLGNDFDTGEVPNTYEIDAKRNFLQEIPREKLQVRFEFNDKTFPYPLGLDSKQNRPQLYDRYYYLVRHISIGKEFQYET